MAEIQSVKVAYTAAVSHFRAWPIDALQTKAAELFTEAAVHYRAGERAMGLHLGTLGAAAERVLETRGLSLRR